MNDRYESPIAVYTARPDEYSGMKAEILDGLPATVEEELLAKGEFLNSAPIIAIDFAGSSDPFSRMSFLTGALEKLASGHAYGNVCIGAGDIPVELLTNDPDERTLVAKARQEGRLSFLSSIEELRNWLRVQTER